MQVHGREVAKETATKLSCVVSDLTNRTTVQWYLDATEIKMSDGKYTVNVDDVIDESQTSILTIPKPSESRVFTCRVSSTLYPDSVYSDTTVHLHVYGNMV